MSTTFSSQGPSVAGQQSIPPGHSPHHGGPPPGHLHGGPPPQPGGMQGPVPNGMSGQGSPHSGGPIPPPHSQYPGHHPPVGPPSSISNGYPGQSGGAPSAGAPGNMPTQQANPQVIQKMLDENSALIKTISDYQNAGKHAETVQYQWTLHRNLVYLASVADSNQNLQNLLPPPGHVPPPGQPPSGSHAPSQQSQPPAPSGPPANTSSPNSGPIPPQSAPPNGPPSGGISTAPSNPSIPPPGANPSSGVQDGHNSEYNSRPAGPPGQSKLHIYTLKCPVIFSVHPRKLSNTCLDTLNFILIL